MYLFSFLKDFLMEPNMLISNIVTAPLIFLGMYINLLFFVNLFNLETTKKQNFQYVIFSGLWTIFCNIFIDNPIGLYIKCLILPRNRYVYF